MTNSHDIQAATQRQSAGAGEAIDIQRVFSIFRRRIKLFAAVAVVIAAAVLFLLLRQAPEYTATTSVQINSRTERVVESQAVLSNLTADTSVVDTEVEALKSPELIAAVVDTLRLEQDPEFNARLVKPGKVMTVKRMLGLSQPLPTPTTAAEREAERQSVIGAVGMRLGVRRVGLTYSMNVSFSSRYPAKAARIANTFAEQYLAAQLNQKSSATQEANTFLNTRLDDLRRQVQEADAEVSNYRVANNLLSSAGTTLTEQEISAYNQQLALVRAQEAEERARLRTATAQLAAGSNGDDVGEALDSTVVQQLRSQRAVVSGRVAEMTDRYGPRHPDIIRAQSQLADIDNQIQAEIRRIISNLEARVRVAQERTGSVASSLGSARGTLAVNSAASVRLKELEGNAESVRTIYQSYLDRFKETGALVGAEQADARIVARASIPTRPSSPNIPLNVAIAIVLGLGAGTAAIILAEMLDAGLGTSEEVERKLGLPAIGSIPLMSSIAEGSDKNANPIDFVLMKPLSGYAEAFRSLRTSITYSVSGQAGKVVVLTSALPAEGKTTTSVCLARVAAQSGSRVVLLDCDLRRRAVTRALGISSDHGLIELLHGNASLEQALTLDQASGAYVLPLTHTTSSTEDIFGSQAMDQLLKHLRTSFDLVLLDTAPVLALADTRIVANKADMVVLLARWRKTPARAISNSIKLLQQSGAHIAGIALTQVDMNAQAKHGYGDAGYYYDDYKKYYAS
jgi:succinoglycan biosynthesis transport protein ExoP